MGKLAILEMVLFNEPSNKQRATRRVVDVFRWWVSINLESIKQWVDPESTRAQNGILLRWSWLRIKREVRETKSEWGLEKADALSQIRLVAIQGSSMQSSVCAESWGLLSIFLRVSWSQSISSCWSTAALGRDHGLFLGAGVQLVVSCTVIEAQVVFKILLILVTGQLAVAGQLGREVHPQSIGLLLGSRRQRWLEGRALSR